MGPMGKGWLGSLGGIVCFALPHESPRGKHAVVAEQDDPGNWRSR